MFPLGLQHSSPSLVVKRWNGAAVWFGRMLRPKMRPSPVKFCWSNLQGSAASLDLFLVHEIAELRGHLMPFAFSAKDFYLPAWESMPARTFTTGWRASTRATSRQNLGTWCDVFLLVLCFNLCNQFHMFHSVFARFSSILGSPSPPFQHLKLRRQWLWRSWSLDHRSARKHGPSSRTLNCTHSIAQLCLQSGILRKYPSWYEYVVLHQLFQRWC